MLAGRANAGIRFKRLASSLDRARIIKAVVIDKSPNRDELGKLRYTPIVVRMKMSDQQIIDSFHAGGGCYRSDAVGIARFMRVARLRSEGSITRKPGIDKQRLVRWRHNQRGLTAFNVDEIDL